MSVPKMLFIVAVISCCTTGVTADQPILTSDEQTAGFELLFNGENLDGWKQSGNWKVKNGVLTRGGKGGSLTFITKKIPDDFELRFDWKVAKGSNSGVYYRRGSTSTKFWITMFTQMARILAPVPRRCTSACNLLKTPRNRLANGTKVVLSAKGA